MSDASRFRARRKELGLGPLVIHDNYLINLASANPVLRTRSVQAFHQELVRAIALGADYLVAHPGCCGADRGVAQAVSADGARIKASGARAEARRSAVASGKYGGAGNFDRLEIRGIRGIIDACSDLPLGVCIDTAHLFASGWDIRTSEGLERR